MTTPPPTTPPPTAPFPTTPSSGASTRDVVVAALAGLGATSLVALASSALISLVMRSGGGIVGFRTVSIAAAVVAAVVGPVIAVLVHTTRPAAARSGPEHWLLVAAPVVVVLGLHELLPVLLSDADVRDVLRQLGLVVVLGVVGLGASLATGALAVRSRPTTTPPGGPVAAHDHSLDSAG